MLLTRTGWDLCLERRTLNLELGLLPLPLLGGLDTAHEDAACISGKIIQRAGYALAALLEHMRVNHRRGHIGMTQQFLDSADVRAPLQKMGRKAVPETVRADDLGQSHPARRHLDPKKSS